MFDQHIAATRDFIFQRTIGSDDRIKFSRLRECDVPESLIRFFEMDINTWEQEEKARLLNSPHFDYSDPRILEMFDSILAEAGSCALFMRDEFETAIDKSIKLLFNYVVHPQWTLAKFIYAEKEHVFIEDIMSAMSYFVDYPYFKLILSEYFKTRDYLHFTRDKFEELLGTIDREVVKHYDSHKMAEITQPVFDLFNLASGSEEPRVPIEALSIFYEDKDMRSIVDALEAEKTKSDTISMHELTMMLGEVDFSIGIEISNIVGHHLFDRPLTDGDMKLGTPDIELEKLELPDEPIYIRESDFPPLPDLASDMSKPAAVLEPEIELPPIVLEDNDEDILVRPAAEPLSGIDDIFLDETVLSKSDDEEFESVEDMPISVPDIHLVDDKKDIPGMDTQPSGNIQDDIALLHEKLNLVLEDDQPLPANVETQSADRNTEDVMEQLNAILMEEPEIEEIATVTAEAPEASVIEAPAVAPQPEHAPALETDLIDFSEPEPETRTPPSDLPDIKTLIPSGDRKKFIKKIFNKNETNYEAVIDDLNMMHNWREASEKIDEVFAANNIDTYSRYAVRFTDMVYKRFAGK